MAVTKIRQTMHEKVGEQTVCTLRIPDVQVPDGAGGLRFATAPELADVELTVTDHLGAIVNELDAVPVLPSHGSYNATTGVLLVNLVADDNPIASLTLAAGEVEQHMAFVHMPDLLWVEIVFNVQNSGLIPNPP